MSAVRYRTEPLASAAALRGSTTRQRPDASRTDAPSERPASPDPTDLLKPAEVARRLKVSRSWVYDAAADGRLPSIRLGTTDGPLRFVRTDLEQWIEDARTRAVERFS
ncbi:MAG: helix-turn-helix domain-containing protein [Conexibacter sp.]